MIDRVLPIVQLARGAERRLRLRRALGTFAIALGIALALACVVLVLRKTLVLGEKPARIALVVLGVSTLVSAVIAYQRRLAKFAGSVAVDRSHNLADRLSSALSFAEEKERTPLMDAAIDDALVLAQGTNISLKKAVPLPLPRFSGWTVAFGGLFALLALFEVRRHEIIRHADMLDAVDVTPDDIDAMREFLKELERKDPTDDTKAATQEFNQLIEDLANHRVDRSDAFRRLQALEDKLMQGKEGDAKALEEAMKRMSEELKKSDLSKPSGEALSQKNFAQAERDMRELAKKLREGKPDKAQLDKLREALKRASENQKEHMAAVEKKRAELEKQLLEQKKKMPDGGASEQEKSLLQKKERELERMQREEQEAKNAERQLDRLDRNLQKAAEDLMKDLGLSAQDLEQGAEDINRMGKQQMSDEEKDKLRQKLQELKELMRQGGRRLYLCCGA